MDFRGQPKDDPEINLIPLIDVLLVIIIFLMLTTTYSKFAELQINLPSADAERPLERPNDINKSYLERFEAFRGFLTLRHGDGEIEEIWPDKGQVRVIVSILGRPTPVELEYWKVEPV